MSTEKKPKGKPKQAKQADRVARADLRGLRAVYTSVIWGQR